jgi:4-hydroxy-tetrahydrodipicolinate synthase
MQADGSVDLYALADHTAWVLTGGVHMIVACGTTGESATLSPDEQREVIACCVEVAAGRVPVIAGAGGNDTRAVAALARAAADAGADAVLTVTPYYNKPPVAGLVEHFRAVSEACALPVILYNVPGRTASNVAPRDVLRIAHEVPGVVGVKEASGDLRQMMTLLDERPDDFVVLSGDDDLTLPLLALGGDGVISVVANEAPGPMARLYDAAVAGDWADARGIHERLLALMRANFVEPNPMPVKTALELMGRTPAQFRLPLVRIPARHESRAILRAALEAAGLIEPFAPPTI